MQLRKLWTTTFVPLIGLVLATSVDAAAAARPEGPGDRWFSAESGGNPRLEDAHRAFLEGRFLDMGLALKDVLSAPELDQATRQNALDLTEQAFDAQGGGKGFADWPLPREVTKLRAMVRHKESQYGATYNVVLKADETAPGALVGMRLSTPDGKVFLDRRAGIGGWEEDHDADGDHVRLRSENRREPPPAGVYLVDLELASGEATHGWFIMNRAVSSAVPAVSSPAPDQVLTTRTPTVTWQAFKSPEYKPFESRALAVGVDLARGDATPWEWWGEDAARTSIAVGDPAGTGVPALADGRYILRLSSQEVRRFGNVHIRRESIRLVPFTVAAGAGQ